MLRLEKISGKANLKMPAKRQHIDASVISERCERATTGCLLWQGATNTDGYGLIRHQGTLWKVHRLMYTLMLGPISNGMLVCHTCDVPRCAEPTHHFLGTHADNAHDRDRKGRQVALVGEQHPRSVVTQDQANRIRNDRRPARVIAKQYGVHPATIYRIRQGKTYET